MPTEQKARTIEQTKAKYQRAAGVLFTEYRGLKVSQLQALRRDLQEKGGEFHVVKNTLFKIAAGDDAAILPESLTSGPTGIAFIYENEPACAKALLDFSKTNKALVVKGALIGGKAFDDKQVEALSKLPAKEVLIAQVIGAIAAPLSNLVGVIEALYADPIRVIGAVADKVAEGSPAPVTKEEAPSTADPAESTADEAPAAEATEAPAEATAAEATEATAEAPTEETPTE
ncbi:MAG: 50S ribosomal protein L10 [Fimbriimonadaceae bacterium]|nr:50S ribosomal protein L10 [Fimbriimonadaceae bacterium]QYK59644.1 MAG: 50S ribosomal protein L10 [Fimbriimonadaceae bacterium]